MKVYSAIADVFVKDGVDTVFGLVGDGNLRFVDSFVNEYKGTYVAAAHEAGVMFMAFGYGYVSDRLAVATVTHGPALTNTLTGLVEAVRGRVPLVLVAGDTEDPASVQNIAQRDVVLPTGAGFVQVRSAGTAAADTAAAIRQARAERRPVVLNVPVELMTKETGTPPVVQTVVPATRTEPDAASLKRALEIIAEARQPVLLAGWGARDDRAELLALADRIGARVATTLKGNGLFRGSPRDLGFLGRLASPEVAEVWENADCVIAFGTSLTKLTTRGGDFLRGKRLIHCEPDAGQIGLAAPVDVGLVGDPGRVAAALLDGLGAGGAAAPAPAPLAPPTWPTKQTAEGTVDLWSTLSYLDNAVPEDRIYVTDGGRFMVQAWKLIQAPDPRSFVYPNNFGSIGTGMGAAVGAAFAAPGRPILMVTGDGGFMHGGLAEFNTAVRYGLDLIVVVCNDAGYGAEHVQLVDHGLDTGLAFFDWPELATVAEALGGQGCTVRRPEDLERAAKAIAQRDRPLLIDVKLDMAALPPLW
ncbi:thiamine pyrophosphate-binding protein [Micromonospora sp. NPDC050397]|uniref:thiamine pyrophosphate-binding protein n=1 Tax=Micromonospora sp. NPDC050397 TaxID=3364279 RepID=UPI00384CA267